MFKNTDRLFASLGVKNSRHSEGANSLCRCVAMATFVMQPNIPFFCQVGLSQHLHDRENHKGGVQIPLKDWLRPLVRTIEEGWSATSLPQGKAFHTKDWVRKVPRSHGAEAPRPQYANNHTPVCSGQHFKPHSIYTTTHQLH